MQPTFTPPVGASRVDGRGLPHTECESGFQFFSNRFAGNAAPRYRHRWSGVPAKPSTALVEKAGKRRRERLQQHIIGAASWWAKVFLGALSYRAPAEGLLPRASPFFARQEQTQQAVKTAGAVAAKRRKNGALNPGALEPYRIRGGRTCASKLGLARPQLLEDIPPLFTAWQRGYGARVFEEARHLCC